MHSFGVQLRATVEGIRALVMAMHDGRLGGFPAPTALRRSATYWTPSFQQGRPPDLPASKPYNPLDGRQLEIPTDDN
jgi:hypothetical protein